MMGLGWFELVVIFLIVLIVFGAGRLPEIGSGLGKGIMNFKKSVTESEKALKEGAQEAKGEDTKEKDKPA
ncbi:MAG: twin-arginine translocase TatA/TatE family subunit [Nitrospinota bacterium]|nr:twin-arginine translocase TatA/TatE family subunit [Nitrospinota bacterium]